MQGSSQVQPQAPVDQQDAHLKLKCRTCRNTLAYGILGPGSAIEIKCRHCRTPDGERTKTMFETPA